MLSLQPELYRYAWVHDVHEFCAFIQPLRGCDWWQVFTYKAVTLWVKTPVQAWAFKIDKSSRVVVFADVTVPKSNQSWNRHVPEAFWKIKGLDSPETCGGKRPEGGGTFAQIEKCNPWRIWGLKIFLDWLNCEVFGWRFVKRSWEGLQ